jgi:hypothetical protein
MIALLSYRAIHIERGGSADLSTGLGRLGETAPRCRPYVGRRDRGAGFATSGQTFGICCHSGESRRRDFLRCCADILLGGKRRRSRCSRRLGQRDDNGQRHAVGIVPAAFSSPSADRYGTLGRASPFIWVRPPAYSPCPPRSGPRAPAPSWGFSLLLGSATWTLACFPPTMAIGAARLLASALSGGRCIPERYPPGAVSNSTVDRSRISSRSPMPRPIRTEA